jgi:hypothetical protein
MASALTSALIPTTSPNPSDPTGVNDDDMDLFDSLFGAPTPVVEGPRVPTWMAPKSGYQFHEFKPDAWSSNQDVVQQQVTELEDYISKRGAGRSPSIVANEWLTLKRKEGSQKSPFQQRVKDQYGVDVVDDPIGFRDFMASTPTADTSAKVVEFSKIKPVQSVPETSFTNFIDQAFQSHVSDEMRSQAGRVSGRGLHHEYDSALMHVINRTRSGDPNLMGTAFAHAQEVSRVKPGDDPNTYRPQLQAMSTHAEMAALGETDMDAFLKRKKINEYYASPAGRKESVAQRTTWEFVKNHIAELKTETGKGNKIAAATLGLVEGAAKQGKQYQVSGIDDAEASFERFKESPAGKYLTGVTLSQLNGQGIFNLPEAKDAMKQVADGMLNPDDAKLLGSKIRLGTTLKDMLSPKGIKTPEDEAQYDATARLFQNQLDNGSTSEDAAKPLGRFTNADFLHAITGYTKDTPNNVGLYAQHERSPIFTPQTTTGTFPIASNQTASMNVQGWGTAKNQPQFLGNLVSNLDLTMDQRNKLADVMGLFGDRRNDFLIGINNPPADFQSTLQTLANKVGSETVALTGAQQSNRTTSTISNATQRLMEGLGSIGLDPAAVQDLRATLWEPISGARVQLQGNSETGARRLLPDMYHSFAQTPDGKPIYLQPTKNITGTDEFRMQMSDLFTAGASDSKLRSELNKNMSSVLNDNPDTGSVLFDGDQKMFSYRLEKSLRWLHRTAQLNPDLAADIERNLGIQSILGQSEDGFTKDVLKSLKSNDSGEIGGVTTKFNYLGGILKDSTLEKTVIPGPNPKGPRDLTSPVERAVLGGMEAENAKRRRATNHLFSVENDISRGITDGLDNLTMMTDATTGDINSARTNTRKSVLNSAIQSLSRNQVFSADDGRGLDPKAEEKLTKYVDALMAATWTGGDENSPNVAAAKQDLYDYIDTKKISVTSSSVEARNAAYRKSVELNDNVAAAKLLDPVRHLLEEGTPYGAKNKAVIEGLQQKIGLLELSKEGNDDPDSIKHLDEVIRAYKQTLNRMLDPNTTFSQGGLMTLADYEKRGLPGVRKFGQTTQSGAPFGTLLPFSQMTDAEKMADAEEAFNRWLAGEDVPAWNKVDKSIRRGVGQDLLRYPSSFEGTELFEAEGWSEKMAQSFADEKGVKQEAKPIDAQIKFTLKNGRPNPNVTISRRVIKPTESNPVYKVVYEAKEFQDTPNGKQVIAKAKLIPKNGQQSAESKAYDKVASAKADVDAILDQVKNLPEVAALRAKLDKVTEKLSTTWNEYADAIDNWNSMSVADQSKNPQAKARLERAREALNTVDNDITTDDFKRLADLAPNKFTQVVKAIRDLNEAEQTIRTFADPKHRNINNFVVGEYAKLYTRQSGGAAMFTPEARTQAERLRAAALMKGPKVEEGVVLPGRTADAQRRIDTQEARVRAGSPAVDLGFEPTNDLFYDIGSGFHLWDPTASKPSKIQPREKATFDFTSPGRQGSTDMDAPGDPGREGKLGPIPPLPPKQTVGIPAKPVSRVAMRTSTALGWMRSQPMYQQGTLQQRRIMDDVAKSFTFKLPTSILEGARSNMTEAQKRMYAAEMQVKTLQDTEVARRKKLIGNREIKPDSMIHNARYVGLKVDGENYWLDTDKYLELVKKISTNKITDFSQIWEHGGDSLIVKHVPSRGTTKQPTEIVKAADVPGATENVKRINKSRGVPRNLIITAFTLGLNNLLDTFRAGFSETQKKPEKK